MAMAIAALLFVTYVANVLSGALAGTTYLSDVQEALVLFAASIVFVAAILRAERKRDDANKSE